MTPSHHHVVCRWCVPAHFIGPALPGATRDEYRVCEIARKRLMDPVSEIPSAVCLHGVGKDEYCNDCEACNNESRSIG